MGGDRFNGHQYVDLGLPSGTLWAKVNLGVSDLESPSNSGNFYQYGKGNRQYNKTYNEGVYTGTENPLSLSLDPAQQAWGGEWHVPTKEQFEELARYFDSQGDNGFAFGGNKGQYIILPVRGYMRMGNRYDDGIIGEYMTSTPRGSTNYYTFYINATSEGCNTQINSRYALGVMVRPVVG